MGNQVWGTFFLLALFVAHHPDLTSGRFWTIGRCNCLKQTKKSMRVFFNASRLGVGTAYHLGELDQILTVRIWGYAFFFWNGLRARRCGNGGTSRHWHVSRMVWTVAQEQPVADTFNLMRRGRVRASPATAVALWSREHATEAMERGRVGLCFLCQNEYTESAMPCNPRSESHSTMLTFE